MSRKERLNEKMAPELVPAPGQPDFYHLRLEKMLLILWERVMKEPQALAARRMNLMSRPGHEERHTTSSLDCGCGGEVV